MSDNTSVKKKKKPAFESYTKYALSRKEYQLLLSTCNRFEDEVMLRIAVELGLRRYDLSRIEIANIDLDNMKLIFYEEKKNRNRTLPLSRETCTLLRKYLATLPKNQKYLFSWGKSEHGDSTAWRRLNSLCERAGIERRPFHALRGTCYKFRKAEGWSIEQAAYLLGDDVRTAMLHYGKATDSEIAELMQRED
jgi:integrase